MSCIGTQAQEDSNDAMGGEHVALQRRHEFSEGFINQTGGRNESF
jgi:hypothetical protein